MKFVQRAKELQASSKHHAKVVEISGLIQKTIQPPSKRSLLQNSVPTLRKSIMCSLQKEPKLLGLRQRGLQESRLSAKRGKEKPSKSSWRPMKVIKDQAEIWQRKKLVLTR